MQITVQSRQTLLDIALRECGSAEGVFALAQRNGLSITDTLEPGQILEIAAEDIADRQVAGHYKANGIMVATELTRSLQEGIEFWAIEYDFIVS